jgi:hypothetical protein
VEYVVIRECCELRLPRAVIPDFLVRVKEGDQLRTVRKARDQRTEHRSVLDLNQGPKLLTGAILAREMHRTAIAEPCAREGW